MNAPQPFRQIHLDFHTSDQIPAVGAAFEPEVFAATLARAHVNSINFFARCHHGWLYYDSQRFPARRHPTLRQPLLAAQIEACHAHGIRTPIYVTVQWDDFTARQHLEWLACTEDGREDSHLPPTVYQLDHQAQCAAVSCTRPSSSRVAAVRGGRSPRRVG